MNCKVFLERMIIGSPDVLSRDEKLEELMDQARQRHGQNIELESIEYHLFSIEADVYLVSDLPLMFIYSEGVSGKSSTTKNLKQWLS